uniref:Ig-like domain-containing protein n=1 Tax=Anas zonorhyncha TaxID=75864 RepID=A0A8B9UEN8_9AVES
AEMCSLPGVLLLLLTGATSAEEPWIQQSPAELWLSPGETAELNCNISGSPERANWYREKPDGSLEWIYWSTAASKPEGRYSGMMRARGIFPLNISNVQREDSGYYYCTSSVSHSQFGKGTRLLVTNASEPKVSILVPVDTEEPSDFVPLLCQLPSGWDTVRWQHGRDTPVTAMDEDELGVPGAWNLTWVSAEHWDGAMNCTATERGTGRIVSETIGTGELEQPPPGHRGLCSVLGLCLQGLQARFFQP